MLSAALGALNAERPQCPRLPLVGARAAGEAPLRAACRRWQGCRGPWLLGASRGVEPLRPGAPRGPGGSPGDCSSSWPPAASWPRSEEHCSGASPDVPVPRASPPPPSLPVAETSVRPAVPPAFPASAPSDAAPRPPAALSPNPDPIQPQLVLLRASVSPDPVPNGKPGGGHFWPVPPLQLRSRGWGVSWPRAAPLAGPVLADGSFEAAVV